MPVAAASRRATFLRTHSCVWQPPALQRSHTACLCIADGKDGHGASGCGRCGTPPRALRLQPSPGKVRARRVPTPCAPRSHHMGPLWAVMRGLLEYRPMPVPLRSLASPRRWCSTRKSVSKMRSRNSAGLQGTRMCHGTMQDQPLAGHGILPGHHHPHDPGCGRGLWSGDGLGLFWQMGLSPDRLPAHASAPLAVADLEVVGHVFIQPLQVSPEVGLHSVQRLLG